MKQQAFDTSNVVDEEQYITLQSASIEPVSSVSSFNVAAFKALSIDALAAQCSIEIDNYRNGEPWTGEYGLELLRRAIVQGDQEVWAGVQHCFNGLVRRWLRRHPKSDIARRLESEENYVAQTFERFWQATSLARHVEFNTLAAALQYLHASLNGVILDTLRAYVRPREVMLPKTDEAGELQAEDTIDSSEVWETLETMLSDVREIYHLRRNIIVRLLHRVEGDTINIWQ